MRKRKRERQRKRLAVRLFIYHTSYQLTLLLLSPSSLPPLDSPLLSCPICICICPREIHFNGRIFVWDLDLVIQRDGSIWCNFCDAASHRAARQTLDYRILGTLLLARGGQESGGHQSRFFFYLAEVNTNGKGKGREGKSSLCWDLVSRAKRKRKDSRRGEYYYGGRYIDIDHHQKP